MTELTAYPLTWPAAWPRTAQPQRSRFDTTMAQARDEKTRVDTRESGILRAPIQEATGAVVEHPPVMAPRRWRSAMRSDSILITHTVTTEYELDHETGAVKIPLISDRFPGLFALVDIDDAPLVSPYRWHPDQARNTFYAQATILETTSERRHNVRMHRLITGISDQKVLVDHRSRDGLDNRRSNIRIATPMQNSGNAPGRPGTSNFRGVCWDNNRGKWLAQIKAGGPGSYIGRFESEIEAALAYDERARELFGPFAHLNFPDRIAS